MQHICNCGNRYKIISTLNVHIRRHTDKHICIICKDFTTSEYSLLKRHYNTLHPNTPYQNSNLMQQERSAQHFIRKTTSTSFKRRRQHEFYSTQYEPSNTTNADDEPSKTTDTSTTTTQYEPSNTTKADNEPSKTIDTSTTSTQYEPSNTTDATTTSILNNIDAPTKYTATNSTKRQYPFNTVSKNNTLTIHDYNTLISNGKLNDNIIDAYYTLITCKYSFIHAFNCFFLHSLNSNRSSYLTNRNKIDLLKHKILICPIHISEPKHWTVIIINFHLNYIHHLDSYPQPIITDDGYIHQIRNFLDKYTTINNIKKYNWAEWVFKIPRDIPMQSLTDNNCGIFICLYVKHLCTNQYVNTMIIPHNIDAIRDMMINELKTNILTE